MPLRTLLATLFLWLAALPLGAQFTQGPPIRTAGWAPASIGVRGGYDNGLRGWMVGGFIGVPILPRGYIELMPSADVTFLPGFEEYQGNLEVVYLLGAGQGGLYAGGGVGIRNSMFDPDPQAERRTVRTFSIVIGGRAPTGRFRPQVETRWILQDEHPRDPRQVMVGVGFALW